VYGESSKGGRQSAQTAVWELKFDGYRAVLRVTEAGAELWSRNGSDLSRVFPDLITAAAGQLPVGTLADGEAVVYVDGRLSFDHLQYRMVSAPPAATRLARQYPATYVAFDLLAAAGEDLRLRPWRERRATLEAPPGSAAESGTVSWALANDRWDIIGALLCLVGVAVIMYASRP
jgi:ATP-dependent DNA ligase